MAIEGFLKWMFTTAAKKVYSDITTETEGQKLSRALQQIVKEWASDLPPHLHVSWESLFPLPEVDANGSYLPGVQALIRSIEEGVPPRELLSVAFLERWEQVRNDPTVDDPQPLYKASKSEASDVLNELAGKLWGRYQEVPSLFNKSALSMLQDIHYQVHPQELDLAAMILRFMEDRELLYAAFDLERPAACYKSAEKIREYLTNSMQLELKDSLVYREADAMRSAARAFMRSIEKQGIRTKDLLQGKDWGKTSDRFKKTIEEFRRQCGKSIRQICEVYGISVNSQLRYVMKED